MKLRNIAKGLGRFFGYALLLESALMAIVGVIALLIGIRTWETYGNWLFYGGLVVLVGGLITTVVDPVKTGTRTGYYPRTPANLLVSTEEVWPDRRPMSRNVSANRLAALVGGIAVVIGLMLTGA